MNTYNNSVVVKFDTKVNGNAGVLTPVTVYLTGTATKANLFSPAGASIDNPVFTNSTGNYTFDIEDGFYDIVINEGFLSEVKIENQQIATVVPVDAITGHYDTLQDAISAPIIVGQIITTTGYHTVNDGGAGQYIVVAGGTGTDDGGSYLDMVNGNQLELIKELSITTKQYGASGDAVEVDTTAINSLFESAGTDKNIAEGIYLCNPLPATNKSIAGSGVLSQNIQDGSMLSVYDIDSKNIGPLNITANKTQGGSGHSIVDRDSKFSVYSKITANGMGGRGFGVLSIVENANAPNKANSYTDLKFIGDSTNKEEGNDSGGLLLADNEFCMSSNIYTSDLGQFGTYELKNTSAYNAAVNIVSNKNENAIYFGTETNTDTPFNIVSNVISYNSDYAGLNIGQAKKCIIDNSIIVDDDQSTSSQPHGATFQNAEDIVVSNIKLDGFDDDGRAVYPLRFRGNSNHNFVSVTSNIPNGNLIKSQDTAYKNSVRVDMAHFKSIFERSTTIGDPAKYDGTENSANIYAPFSGEFLGSSSGGYTWMPSFVNAPALFSTDKWRMLDGNGAARAVVGSVSQTGYKFVAGIGTVDVTYTNIVANTNKGLRIDLGFNDNNSQNDHLELSGNEITPSVDNNVSLGNAQKRFSQVFAGTGTINTSDERLKTVLLDISGSERLCALEIKENIRKFKMLDSVNEKGLEKARVHFGVGAQTVGDIFRNHKLAPENYALFCYDDWGDSPEIKSLDGSIVDEKVSAGNRYGIRYDELAMFILSAI